jgi:hypothetical protein
MEYVEPVIEKEIMMRHVRLSSLSGIALVCVAGAVLPVQETRAVPPNASTVDQRYLLKKEPEGAADVIAVREKAKDQQDVLIMGRIGGKKNPWIRGVAAFPIVDRSLKSCDEKGHNCPCPWDFCCSANLPKAMVLVMFVDEKGAVLKKDARELLGVKELDTVVVQGKTRRDKAGNVVILASKLHVHSNHEVAR